VNPRYPFILAGVPCPVPLLTFKPSNVQRLNGLLLLCPLFVFNQQSTLVNPSKLLMLNDLHGR